MCLLKVNCIRSDFLFLTFIFSNLFAAGVREERLKLVQEQMKTQSPNTHVHFELASFAESKLMIDLVENILPFADSLGMNEQVSSMFLVLFILITWS